MNGIGFGRVANTTSGSLRDLAEATGGEFVLAHNSTELFDALDRLLSPVPATPTLDVVFEYEPSADGRWVKNALLEYKPIGQQGVRQVIAEAVAEPKPPKPPKPPVENGTPPDEEKGNLLTGLSQLFHFNFNFTFSAEDLLALLAGAITLFGGGVTYYYLVIVKGKEKEKPRIPPAVISQAPPPPPPERPRRSATTVSPVFPEPHEGKPAAILVATSGPVRGNRYAIDQATLRIGESASNDLCITGDDYVSGKHALIKYEWGSLYLSDLGSRNGTWLNGTRLARTAIALTPGDQIRIGKTVLELQSAQSRSGGEASQGMEPPVS